MGRSSHFIAAGLLAFGLALPLTAVSAKDKVSAEDASDSSSDEAKPPIVVDGEIADANKKVCKRDVATGSIMAKRTCKTKAQWAAEAARGEATKQDLERQTDQRRQSQSVGSV